MNLQFMNVQFMSVLTIGLVLLYMLLVIIVRPFSENSSLVIDMIGASRSDLDWRSMPDERGNVP